jgi:hypothetical protein
VGKRRPLDDGIAERSDHQNWHTRKQPLKFVGRLKTIHHRHGKVHNDQVWMELQGLVDPFATVLSFPANFEARTLLDSAAQRMTNEGAVVNNQNGLQIILISFLLIVLRDQAHDNRAKTVR